MEGGSRRLEGWFVSCQATLAILTYTNQGGFTVGITAERRREIAKAAIAARWRKVIEGEEGVVGGGQAVVDGLEAALNYFESHSAPVSFVRSIKNLLDWGGLKSG